jgi:hypothetical protein
VIGIDGILNVQRCCQHYCCSASLLENELLPLVKCVVTINKKPEVAVKFLPVTIYGDGYTIGILPYVWLKHPKMAQNRNNFCIICELHDYSKKVQKEMLVWLELFSLAQSLLVNK